MASFFALLVVVTSCSSYQENALMGEWVRSETETVTEDDGSLSKVTTLTSLNFKKERLTLRQKSYIDNELAIDISVTGKWEYEQPGVMGFIGSDAIGVISVEWNIDDLECAVNKDFGDIDGKKISTSWESYLENWNQQTFKAKNKNHSKVDFYYGYYLISINGNEMELEEDGETYIYTKDQ